MNRKQRKTPMRPPVLILMLSFVAFLPAAAQDAPAASGHEFTECPNCPPMVAIPAGKFVMGSPKAEPGRFDSEGPQHVVTVKAFALGKYDVTSKQFLAFLAATGYQPKPCNKMLNLGWQIAPTRPRLAYPPSENEPPDWPAVCLDHKDALAYIDWLNVQVKAAHPALANRAGPYRLPSEAEWEYAARAGTNTARWWGDEIGKNNANCNGCGSIWDNSVLAPTTAFNPNAFGLYGMLGNAWQWTADCWHPDYVDAPADGSAWEKGGDCTKHVIRGGSWNNVPIFIRSASRNGATDDGGEYDYSSLSGFRVARGLP
ncbi:MAG TPA: formylglycine-generating enzyme family protein [Rhizomicrobium sp.]|nr:formylglycine-generating enzyme family protein [Rhizomicrobium sp.]